MEAKRQPDCPIGYGEGHGNDPKTKVFISQRPEDHPDAGKTDHSKNAIDQVRRMRDEQKEHIKEEEEHVRHEKEHLKELDDELIQLEHVRHEKEHLKELDDEVIQLSATETKTNRP